MATALATPEWRTSNGQQQRARTTVFCACVSTCSIFGRVTDARGSELTLDCTQDETQQQQQQRRGKTAPRPKCTTQRVCVRERAMAHKRNQPTDKCTRGNRWRLQM